MPLVCAKCVEHDSGLKHFINVEGKSFGNCSYCDTKNNDKKVELKNLTNHILKDYIKNLSKIFYYASLRKK